MPETVKVVIDPDTGEVEVSVSGVKGKNCKKLTEDLERALGVSTSINTNEYYEKEVVKNTIRR